MREPAGTGQGEIVVRRSRFIGIASGFSSSDELKPMLVRTRSDHPGSSHVVYAFVLGPDGARHGMSDDREPRGTAGRPVLEVLKGSGVTNVIVRIIRYFGGVKLGTGGLARAYQEAARLSLDDMPTVELVERMCFELSVPYPQYRAGRSAIESCGGRIEAAVYGTDVRIQGSIPLEELETCNRRLRDISAGNLGLDAPSSV